jgi:hypothetical protein
MVKKSKVCLERLLPIPVVKYYCLKKSEVFLERLLPIPVV